MVTGGCGSATSNQAALTLKAATTITQQPADQNVRLGGDRHLHRGRHRRRHADLPVAEELGQPGNGGHYSGVTTATLTISSATAAMRRTIAAW